MSQINARRTDALVLEKYAKAASSNRINGLSFVLKLDKIVESKLVPSLNKEIFRATLSTFGDNITSVQFSAWEAAATELSTLLKDKVGAVSYLYSGFSTMVNHI